MLRFIGYFRSCLIWLIVLSLPCLVLAQGKSEVWIPISGSTVDYTIEYPANAWETRLVYTREHAPEYMIVEKVQLFSETGGMITIDIWADASGSNLAQWIKSHQDVLDADLPQMQSTTATKRNLPALGYDQITGGIQAYDRRIIFFRGTNEVYRVIYHNADDGASDSVYQHLISTFDLTRLSQMRVQHMETDKGGSPILVYECAGETDDCLCGANNPYPCCSYPEGNCTWWAWDQACCLWNDALPGWGNANQWAGNAQVDGYTVSMTPAVNTIACSNAGDYGHVAWVTQVNGSQVQVTEMAWCQWGEVHTTPYEASYFNQGFVYPLNSATITVTSPNGGDYWYMNQSYNITWTTTGIVGNVLIHLYQGSPPNGTFRQAITSSTANDGVYEWTVFPWLDLASNYYIGIAETDGDPSDFSNSAFSIGPGVGVTTPNGGETYYYNQTYTIQWESYPNYGAVGNVLIHLYQGSSPHGTYNRTITSNTTNDGSYNWTIPCDLSSASNYYIGVAETDGDPSDFSDASFTITGSNPAAPTNLIATDNRCDGIQLTWTDNSTWETEYRVYRGGSLIATLPANSTSHFDTPSTGTYNYYVIAAYPCGASDPSNTDSGTRLTVPSQVTGVSATDNSCSNIVITWNNVSYETGYKVYRDGNWIATTSTDQTNYTDTPGAGTYSYTVRAYNNCGDGTLSSADSGTRLATPTQVTGVSATDNSCTNVVITWIDVSGESGYYIYRNGSQIGQVGSNTTTYTDDTASPGVTYSYTVAAFNACGTGSQSTADSGMRLASPSQVTDVSATDNSCTNVVVTWTDVDDENGYYIYKDGGQVGQVASDVTSFADTPPPGTYSYMVRAYNTCGTSPNSNADDGTRLPAAAPPTNCTASDNDCEFITVEWTDESSTETGFRVYRDGDLAGEVAANVTTYDDSPSPGTYTYNVRAYSECGESDPSNNDDGTRLATPAVPTACAASDTGCSGILVSWVDNAADEDSFFIYRDEYLAASVGPNITSFYDTPQSGSYSYNVRAYNVCGESNASNSDTGARLQSATPPSNCQATDTSCTMIIITWQDNSDNENGFRIYRNGSQVGSVSANVTFFYNFPPSGTYSYTVRAYTTACGNSATAIPDDGTRLSLPTAPQNLTASDTSTTGVYLSWLDMSSNESGFVIYRDLELVHTTAANATTYVDLPGDQLQHEYCITAMNACGESADICDMGQVILGLPTPEGLVLRYDSGWLWLYWQAVRDTNGLPIADIIYNLHRSDIADFVPSPSTLYASTQDTVYVDLIDVQTDKGFYAVIAELLQRGDRAGQAQLKDDNKRSNLHR